MKTDPSTETKNKNKQIARIWRGWTSLENAPKLEKVLRDEAIPSIERNKPKGLRGITLLTLRRNNEVEFTTIMIFDSIESVIDFAGQDYAKAHIDPAVAPFLLRYDLVVDHHQVSETKSWQ